MEKRERMEEAGGKKKEAENIPLKDRIGSMQQNAFHRFPHIFTLLGTFGLVATLYGFERLLDEIPFFADKPLGMLLIGLGVLIATGTLFRQLNGGND